MLLLRNIKVPYDANESEIKKEIEKTIQKKIDSFEIYKKSIDARKGVYYVYQVLIDTKLSAKIIRKLKNNISEYKEEDLVLENKNKVKSAVIVGAGPAGLFAAISLAKANVKVDIIEQGQKIEDRVKTIEDFIEYNNFNERSNIQFGEGGAGTFSDGKLTSRSKDKRSREIFKILVENGAPEDILYDHLPHVGTDILRKVIINIRKSIESLGGKFHFN